MAGREISRAAVVEMQELTLPAVRRYLREAATPLSLPRWQLVFTQLKRAPGGPLAAVLTNPLMLWLCRRIYSQDDHDPGELVESPYLGNLRAIEVICSTPSCPRSTGTPTVGHLAGQPRRPGSAQLPGQLHGEDPITGPGLVAPADDHSGLAVPSRDRARGIAVRPRVLARRLGLAPVRPLAGRSLHRPGEPGEPGEPAARWPGGGGNSPGNPSCGCHLRFSLLSAAAAAAI